MKCGAMKSGARGMVGGCAAIGRGHEATADWVEATYRAWTQQRRVIEAIDELCALDDEDLNEIGLSRDDLTVRELTRARDKRNTALAAIGRWD